MKFIIPFLIAMLSLASVAQLQSALAPGVPSVAIPKTTEVIVVQTPKQGVTRQQIMAISGRRVEEKRARAFILFSGMAGILIAAGAIADPQGRERMPVAARSFYLEAFAPNRWGKNFAA